MGTSTRSVRCFNPETSEGLSVLVRVQVLSVCALARDVVVARPWCLVAAMSPTPPFDATRSI